MNERRESNTDKEERFLDKSKTIKRPGDFKSWDLRDMSELFWMKLGEYVKHPTFEAFLLMLRAWEWAVHEDKALANSFTHALKWCKINTWWEEAEKHGWKY